MFWQPNKQQSPGERIMFSPTLRDAVQEATTRTSNPFRRAWDMDLIPHGVLVKIVAAADAARFLGADAKDRPR